jgi:hypothetical protein
VQTKGKLKVTKNVDVNFICTANCQVSLVASFKVPGPNPPASPLNGQFLANSPLRYTAKFTNKQRKAVRHNAKRVKLKLVWDVVNLDTGATDHVERTFKFKK